MNTTQYEWDIEIVDENGDIIDHNHSDKLDWFGYITDIASNEQLVLVRDVGNNLDGVIDRQWAYVIDGKLPEYFHDSIAYTNIKVPQRFHKELKAWRYKK